MKSCITTTVYKMNNLTLTVEVEWKKHKNFLQEGNLEMDCRCFSCDGNCNDCSICNAEPRLNELGNRGFFGCPIEEMSDKEIENRRSLFVQTYSGKNEILKAPTGYSDEMNGGHYSPDYTENEESLKNKYIERFNNRCQEKDKNKLNIVFKYLQDDRVIKANSLDMFF